LAIPQEGNFSRRTILIARLRMLSMGSALRLRNPKYGPEGSREYLNLILDTAQQGKRQLTDPTARTLIDVETGLTYARLAMIEEAEGNSPAYQTWMQKHRPR